MSKHHRASRRSFLSGAVKTSAFLGLGLAVPAPFRAGQALADARGETDGRVLVVLQLSGGNDGLNTVVPTRDDAYYRLRPRLGIRRKDAVRLDDDYGLGPALAPLGKLYGDGDLAVVHGVGYPNPNRSHFRSMEIWHTGRPDLDEGVAAHGWLGQAIAADPRCKGAALPGAYVGGELPLAMRNAAASASAIVSPTGFAPKTVSGREQRALQRMGGGQPRASGNPDLDFLRQSTGQAFVAARKLAEVARDYKPLADYPATGVGQAFKACAQIIAAGQGTRILYLTLGGFDTHAGQQVAQPRLHGWLADAVAAFLKDQRGHGRADDVAVMIFSEFGRRVKENLSLGTDHGTAGPVLLAGAGVKGGLHGTHPSLTALDAGDLVHTTDFRGVYVSVLEDWLGLPSQPIIGRGFDKLRLFG